MFYDSGPDKNKDDDSPFIINKLSRAGLSNGSKYHLQLFYCHLVKFIGQKRIDGLIGGCTSVEVTFCIVSTSTTKRFLLWTLDSGL